MNLQQLKFIQQVAQQNLSVSDAAAVLHTSQPGVSKQIRLLEEELGIPIFSRTSNRLIGITHAGKAVLKVANRVLLEIENLKKIGSEFSNETSGTLSIATTHTQARYALPRVMKLFWTRYPNVALQIHQGNPTQITEMVVEGKADIAIATEAVAKTEGLVSFPCYEWNRAILTLPAHPLNKLKHKLSLQEIAKYPIITYDFAFAGRSIINETFEKQGLSPNVVVTALDSDVIKNYVELGFGVGLVAQMAFDSKQDKKLRAIDVSHLFKPSTTSIGVRKGEYLRKYMLDFIALFAPKLTHDVVVKSMDL